MSYGAAGFVQGLANSPLGNLSGLMMQKDRSCNEFRQATGRSRRARPGIQTGNIEGWQNL